MRTKFWYENLTAQSLHGNQTDGQNDIITIDTRLIEFHSLIWIVVAVQYRVQSLNSVKLAMNFPVP